MSTDKNTKTDVAPVEEVTKPTTPISTSSIAPKGKNLKRQAPPREKSASVMGIIRSANSHPTEFKYKGEITFIAPNGMVKNVDKSLITMPLPNGLKFIENN